MLVDPDNQLRSEELLHLSFTESRPLHVVGSTVESPEQTVRNYKGDLITVPENMVPMEGGRLITGLPATGQDRGWGSETEEWSNVDEHGYHLPVHDAWVENRLSWSGTWLPSASTRLHEVTTLPASLGSYSVTRTGVPEAYVEKEITPNTDSPYVLLTLRAGTTDRCVLGLWDGVTWEGLSYSRILSGPGRVEFYSGDDSRVWVLGLSRYRDTVVLVNRQLHMESLVGTIRIYPDHPEASSRTTLFLGRARATHGFAPYSFQLSTNADPEPGRYISNEIPNSVMRGAEEDQLPVGWSVVSDGITLNVVGVRNEGRVRCLELRCTGTVITTASSTLYFQLPGIELAGEGDPYYAAVNVRVEQSVQGSNTFVLARSIVHEFNGSNQLLHVHESPLYPATDKHEVFLDVVSVHAHSVVSGVKLQFEAGLIDCVVRIWEPQLVRGAHTPTTFVPTSEGPEIRHSFQGYVPANSALALPPVEGARHYEVIANDLTVLEGDLEEGESLTLDDSLLLEGVLGVRWLISKRAVDLVQNKIALEYGEFSRTDRTQVVQDHEGKLWFSKQGEARRPGNRRVEQLLRNNSWWQQLEPNAIVPYLWSQPFGAGEYTRVLPTREEGVGEVEQAVVAGQQPFLGQSFVLDTYADYTLSVQVDESNPASFSNNSLLWTLPLPSGASLLDTGNAVSGERSYSVLTTEQEGGEVNLRVGLGAGAPLQYATQIRLSRPSLTKGSYVGDAHWVNAEEKYNAGVPGVAYFDEDQFGNTLDSNTVHGVEILAPVYPVSTHPNSFDSWIVEGSLIEGQCYGDARTFKLGGTLSCFISQECYVEEHQTYVVTTYASGGWIKLSFSDSHVYVNADSLEIGSSVGSPLINFSKIGLYTRVDVTFEAARTENTELKFQVASSGASDALDTYQERLVCWLQAVEGVGTAALVNNANTDPVDGDGWLIPTSSIPYYTQGQGTFVIDYDCYSTHEERGLFSLYSSTSSNRIEYVASTRTLAVFANGDEQLHHSFGNVDITDVRGRHRLAITLKGGDIVFSVDGGTPVIDTLSYVPGDLNWMQLGDLNDAVTPLNGTINSFVYDPEFRPEDVQHLSSQQVRSQ